MLRRDEADRRERELIARSRLRIARVASRIALLVIAAIALCTIVQPVSHDPLAQKVLWGLLIVAAAISLGIYMRTRPGTEPLPLWAFYLWTAAVLAFDSAVVVLYGDPSSDIYLVYVLPVLFAAATLPTRAAVGALAAAVGAYVTSVLVLEGDRTPDGLVLRAATFTVIALLGGYLAREQQHEISIRATQERHLAALLARTVSAQEDERKRIARELHDGPLQALSMLSMQLADLEERPGGELAHIQTRIGDLRAALRQTLNEIRRLTQDLRPSALDDLGMVTALYDFAERRCDAAGVELQWDVSGAVRPLDPPLETAVFRIVQEGVNNVVRHAHARSARVALSFERGRLRASVQDDGVGFDEARRPPSSGGAGLYGMRERVELVGGTLAIETAPQHGTRIEAVIPFVEATGD